MTSVTENIQRPDLNAPSTAAAGVSRASTERAKHAGVAFKVALDAQGLRRSLETTDDTARAAAQQLVATALLQPLLSQVRNDPFKSELFHGGQAEDAFGQQLDTLIADRLAKRTNFPIVDAVYQRIMKPHAGKVLARG